MTTNTQCMMIDPTTVRQSRGIWARAVARKVVETPRVDVSRAAAPRAETTPAVAVEMTPPAPAVEAPRLEEMYADLALRTAGLLEHQHAVLDSLERDETDPGRLDQLFALDHLIAQSRRYADSLRLLAGEASLRAPQELCLDDVLHAAASSVQDYPRVRIETTVPQHVLAGAAADVVHLVTETLDQALAAATESVVLVTTAREGEALRIEVTHQSPVATTTDVTVSHLVDRLAQRHGVRVESHEGPQGQTVVSIVLPASALVALPQSTVLVTEPSESDEWRAPVLPLAQPPAAAGRHRRDDATQGLARRSG